MEDQSNKTLVVTGGYESLFLYCAHCSSLIGEGISTESIYGKHGDHLDSVILAVAITEAGPLCGEVVLTQPILPKTVC
ncbi:MAG TPA: hypothetical protein VKZ53_19120 [Candidatus Angelobacter sp.]|nr:hypothetical protein [Candidatus Angelobacter sp.]